MKALTDTSVFQADPLDSVRILIRFEVSLYILPPANVHQSCPRKFKDGVWRGADYARDAVIDPYADNRPQNHAICHRRLIGILN